ncbi:hypothetical protein J4Q44_G00137500 [Coregonus suidteri]|uniref:Uncharacterized protein n=1 Tax=Coregonus suidteri TaxID=861788 RepID=A0AAN8M3A3_9TELE
MVETYGPEVAVKISLEILRMRDHNNLVEQLKAGYKIDVSVEEEVAEETSTPVSDRSSDSTETGGHAMATTPCWRLYTTW